MNDKLRKLNGVPASGFEKADRVGDVESAIVEIAEMVADNEVTIEDLTSAVLELAEIIGGNE